MKLPPPSEPATVLLASATSVALLFGIDVAGCQLRACGVDDAALRAGAMLDLPLLIGYLLLSWLFVFPAMLGLRERFGRWRPAALVALVCALLGAALLHRADIDGSFLATALKLTPWLGLPWFAGGLVALAFWPATRGTKPSRATHIP